MTPLCVDVKEAATLLRISVWSVRRHIDDGDLPTVQFPSGKIPGTRSRRILIAVADLEAFVATHRTEGSR